MEQLNITPLRVYLDILGEKWVCVALCRDTGSAFCVEPKMPWRSRFFDAQGGSAPNMNHPPLKRDVTNTGGL